MLGIFEIIMRTIALGIVGVLVIFGVNNFSATTTVPVVTKAEVVATSSLKTTALITKPTTSATSTVLKNTATSSKITPVTKKPTVTTTAKTDEKIAVSILPKITASFPLPTISEINTLTRSALVNILCTTSGDGGVNPITGSGVVIDERGVILTNAHIGQFFLLKDYPRKNNVDCVIRMGSPATPLYRAELLYLSPLWVESNSKNITEQNPLGTGENDFALLFINSSVHENIKLPVSFSYVTPNTEEQTQTGVTAENYVVGGYPAGFLGGIEVLKDLYISSASVKANQIFTFKENTIDLLALGGSVLAQKGASGGAVVRQQDKKLVGIIVTTTDAKTTGERDLRAITTTHINRSIQASTGKTLPGFLTGSLSEKVNEFNRTLFPALKGLLVTELNK